MRLLCLLSLLAATVAFKIAGTRLARATFPPGPLFAQGGGWSSGGNGKGNGKTAQAEEELARLLAISSAEGRGAQSSLETLDAIAATILILEGANPTKEPVNSELIDGCWKLLYTSSPGTNSPIQKTFTAFNGVSIYQVVNLIDQTGSFLSGKRDVSNTVCFGDRARLRVTALASTPTQPLITPRKGDGKILGMNIFGISSSALPRTPLERIDFAFQEAMFEFKGFGESGLKPPSIPYPVPFKLLGDEAKGWLDSTYLSPRFRISKGNKGTTFVLERADMADPTAIFATEKLDKSVKAGAGTAGAIQVQVGTGAGATAPRPPPPRISFGDPFSSFKTLFAPKTQSQKGNKASSRRVAIIFPAQLGTGADYTDLVEAIAQETRQGGTGLGQGGQGMGQGTGMGGVKAYVAPLSRINWPLGLLPSFFSPDYAMATLQ
ncbi:hypothetical protein B484DRAFT_323088 [Ochromonadaceae sp. CCMP2298]|nr:hypothetical protein B484DRAFT_323088 [Ochromonadaceae sp. CCMP2298]